MTNDAMTSVERLAQRLLDGPGDPAGYHELRAEALVQAHAWKLGWLAAELMGTFDRAEREQRPLTETAAIVQGLVRSARLAIHHPVQGKSSAWTNPALVAATITAGAMIVAAVINHWGELGKKPVPTASVPAAILKPNIQIMMPSAEGPRTVIVAPPTHTKPATPTAPPATPAPPTEPASPPDGDAGEPHQP